MKAMILAAGRGERMRPLTDTIPKPLLLVGEKPLIVWHLERLAASGFSEIIINHVHLGQLIEEALGDGGRWGINIHYSPEPDGALETAGGIAKALPLLGNDPFLVVNGDVWCDWDFKKACQLNECYVHLVLVNNPPERAGGDFCLLGKTVYHIGKVSDTTLTYAGIGVFSPDFFDNLPQGGVVKMYPLLSAAITQKKVTGEHHLGEWMDVGTPLRLQELNCRLKGLK